MFLNKSSPNIFYYSGQTEIISQIFFHKCHPAHRFQMKVFIEFEHTCHVLEEPNYIAVSGVALLWKEEQTEYKKALTLKPQVAVLNNDWEVDSYVVVHLHT